MNLTSKKVKILLSYNYLTGYFFWNKRPKHTRIDITQPAGCHDKKGYIIIRIKGKGYKAHRLAFLWMEGYWPEHGIDHDDRIKDNNIWNNLKETSQSCNCLNKNIMLTNTSGVTGVCWIPAQQKWRATFRRYNIKNDYQGQYTDFEDAVRARWEAEKKYKYARCNSTSSAYLYLQKHNLLS